jgi:hypothetical protein
VRRIENLLEHHTRLGFKNQGPRASLFLAPNPSDGSLWYTRDHTRKTTPIDATSITAYLENSWRHQREDGTARLHVQLNAGTPILLQLGMGTHGARTLLAAFLDLESHGIDPTTDPITIYPVRGDQGRTTFLRVRGAGRVIITDKARDLNAGEALATLAGRYGFYDPYDT